MLEALKEEVCRANIELSSRGLAPYTWGNVSGIDRKSNLIVIKPSGVRYEELKADLMVVVDLEGEIVEGNLNPSSDTQTHIELYKAFNNANGIAHTHSTYAVAWAQAGLDIPCYGTTHADYFYGSIPCTRILKETEVAENYEKKTGEVIVETFHKRALSSVDIPGIICNGHGPFTWGKSAVEAVFHAVVMEEVAHMAWLTYQLNPNITTLASYVCDKHYFRKHGKAAYYGQHMGL